MKKQLVFCVLLVVTVIALTGCSSMPMMTWGAPGMTSRQVDQRHYEAIQVDIWQLQDDIDAFFLFDRPGRMHRMVVR